MREIRVKVLNCSAVEEAEKNMVFAARLTQRGHQISNMESLMDLYERSFSEETVSRIGHLPHPTLQKFSMITVAVVGASRRFLSQIIRHQNEVKYMSASLQYSDYCGKAAFVIPYEILKFGGEIKRVYEESCMSDMVCYEKLRSFKISNDTAGYVTPQGLRNVLLISATPYQWKHMISQRTCRRNTDETRIVMLKIWKELYELSPVMFAPDITGPFCMKGKCLEGNMSCQVPLDGKLLPAQILDQDYPVLKKGLDEGKND